MRGEYLYTANGPGGFEVFDVANIDQKGFSERIVTAPVSPLGQRTYVRTKYATSRRAAEHARRSIRCACACRKMKSNRSISFYACVYVSDREEGLVIVNVGTLVDGNPDNNFLKERIVRLQSRTAILTGATLRRRGRSSALHDDAARACSSSTCARPDASADRRRA